ncbi:MAG: hypothetical protein ACI9EW_003638, partial [Cellvibrionaceae bacterium]
DRLRMEMETLGAKLTDLEWYTQQINFLQGHTYFTEAAWLTRHPQKLKNIEWLKKIVVALKADT